MPNESAKIILAVTNGKLSKVRDFLAVEGTINALKVEFQFRTQDWDDTTKMAVFVRGRATPSTTNADITYVILDGNNECDVPAEILAKDGMFSVGIFGTRDDYRIVSNWMCYRVADGCYADGSTPIDPSSTLYEQIISMLNNKSEIGHNHDERYYTKEEIEDRFISEDEVDVTKPKLSTITLLATDWVGEVSPYSQVVNISGVTSTSKIDLQPTAAQLVELQDAEITLIAENNNRVITIYALNNEPTKDYTMQVLITEVQSI